ncbi:MAG: SCO family protein [Phycisphaeraceae bacterium]|nr:SCO family protein [Phycisphaeraceae bacterium]
MPRVLKLIVAIAGVLGVGSAVLLVVLVKSTERSGDPMADSSRPVNARPAEPDEEVIGLSIPEFAMIDQDGRPFSRADLAGHVTVINFIFTNCPLICPFMTDTMSEIATRLRATDARFVSFSVDPVHDTPERLRAFAARYQADHRRWKFVTEHGAPVSTLPDPAHEPDANTADRPTIVGNILRNGLRMMTRPNPDEPITLSDGSTMANIIHPEWFVLLDRDARVLGIYRRSDPAQVDALVERIQRIDRAK